LKRHGTSVGYVLVASVCSSFESPDLKIVFGTRLHLQNYQVKFVYEGYWVKVQITPA